MNVFHVAAAITDLHQAVVSKRFNVEKDFRIHADKVLALAEMNDRDKQVLSSVIQFVSGRNPKAVAKESLRGILAGLQEKLQ